MHRGSEGAHGSQVRTPQSCESSFAGYRRPSPRPCSECRAVLPSSAASAGKGCPQEPILDAVRSEKHWMRVDTMR
eukprot:16761-Pleurochrysis_carterae.AAC.2